MSEAGAMTESAASGAPFSSITTALPKIRLERKSRGDAPSRVSYATDTLLPTESTPVPGAMIWLVAR
jgi:hypothetical protein